MLKPNKKRRDFVKKKNRYKKSVQKVEFNARNVGIFFIFWFLLYILFILIPFVKNILKEKKIL